MDWQFGPGNEMDKEADFYGRLRAAGKYDEVEDQFKKLKTDQERVVFTLNVMQEYNIVPSTTGMSKNAEESEKLREEGNEVYVKGILDNKTCIEALKLYTKSIAFSPADPSEQLAFGYANRSAVLFQLGLHSECIQDIDRALVLNYPDNLRAKLYLRKTECLMILANRSVEDVLQEAQHWLNKMSIFDTNREKLQAKFDVLHDKNGQTELCAYMDTEAKVLEKQPPLSPLPIIESYNDEVPCASNAVAIKYNERYGRHVVATRNIRPGEVIAVEKPYSLLKQRNMETHCSNCLRVCWANIPCNNCTYAMYCSEECRDIEWKKCHDVECAIAPVLIEYAYDFNLALSIRIAVLALREAGGIKELKMMLKEVDERHDPRTKGFSQDGKLHSDKYISVYSLVTNAEKRPVSHLFRTAFHVSFILYFLATRTVIFGAKLLEDLSALAENNDVTFFGGLILRHQQIILSNGHTFGGQQGLEIVELGPAVMPFLSLINHSCNRNIFRQSIPEHIVVYAMTPIRKGEQLLDSYGPEYYIMSRATRQGNLLMQYCFTCDCIPCQEDWPCFDELQSYEALVKRPEDKAKIEKALRVFLICHRYFLARGSEPHVIENFLEMVQVLHDCAPMPCKEMCVVIKGLKRAYARDGNIFEIPQVSTYRK